MRTIAWCWLGMIAIALVVLGCYAFWTMATESPVAFGCSLGFAAACWVTGWAAKTVLYPS